MVNEGNDIIFSKKGSFVKNVPSGKVIKLNLHQGILQFDIWVKKANEETREQFADMQNVNEEDVKDKRGLGLPEAGDAHLRMTSMRPKSYYRRFGQKRKKNGGELNELDDDGNEIEEAIRVKLIPNVCLPCEAEVNLHNLTHLLFRDWCPYCVQGKAVGYPHLKRLKEEDEVPVISLGYMGLKHREPEEGQNPIIVTVDRRTKMKFAHVLKSKGVAARIITQLKDVRKISRMDLVMANSF